MPISTAPQLAWSLHEAGPNLTPSVAGYLARPRPQVTVGLAAAVAHNL
jgi:hypothetical protein